MEVFGKPYRKRYFPRGINWIFEWETSREKLIRHPSSRFPRYFTEGDYYYLDSGFNFYCFACSSNDRLLLLVHIHLFVQKRSNVGLVAIVTRFVSIPAKKVSCFAGGEEAFLIPKSVSMFMFIPSPARFMRSSVSIGANNIKTWKVALSDQAMAAKQTR